jgi:hypothetical protein
MVRNLEYRIMQNRPGTGWYWEVVECREVVARGLTDTHPEAVSQAAEVARAARGEQLQRSAPQLAASSFLDDPRPPID